MLRRLIALAVPLIVSTGSFTVMQFFDRMFLAWHSADAVRAALPAGFLALNFMIGPMMITGITSMLAAQHVGAQEPHLAARATAQGVWASLLCWPVLLACIPLGLWILRLSDHPPAVLHDEKIYFSLLMAAGVTAPLKSALSGFFSGIGRTGVVMWTSLIANAVNIVLDYVLIFGAFGLPPLGIAGAALATVIAEVTHVALYLLVYLHDTAPEYAARAQWRWEGTMMRKLIRFGLPSGIHLVMEFAAFSVFLLLTGRLVAEEAVASNIALNVNHVAVMPILGISFAITTLVGQFQGAGQHRLAARAGWAAVGLGQLLMAAAAASFVFLPEFYIDLYVRHNMLALDTAAIHASAVVLLRIMAVWGVFDTFSLIMAGALRGAGDTAFVMWYSLGVAWLFYVPGLLWLIVNGHTQLLPLWGWTATWVIVLATGFVVRFHRGTWMAIRVVDAPTAPPANSLASAEGSGMGAA
jgi:MATE family multidrug resistance protein